MDEGERLFLESLDKKIDSLGGEIKGIRDNQEKFRDLITDVQKDVAVLKTTDKYTKECVDTHEDDINHLKSVVGRHSTYFKLCGIIFSVGTVLASLYIAFKEKMQFVEGGGHP